MTIYRTIDYNIYDRRRNMVKFRYEKEKENEYIHDELWYQFKPMLIVLIGLTLAFSLFFAMSVYLSDPDYLYLIILGFLYVLTILGYFAMRSTIRKKMQAFLKNVDENGGINGAVYFENDVIVVNDHLQQTVCKIPTNQIKTIKVTDSCIFVSDKNNSVVNLPRSEELLQFFAPYMSQRDADKYTKI